MNINKLESLRKLKKITQAELAESIGMSETALNQAIKNEKFKVETLEKIAEVLKVPIGYFFDDREITVNRQDNGLEDKFELTIQLKIKDKEKERDILKMVFGNEFIKLLNK